MNSEADDQNPDTTASTTAYVHHTVHVCNLNLLVVTSPPVLRPGPRAGVKLSDVSIEDVHVSQLVTHTPVQQ